jgi:hypothetical protein
MRPHSAAAHARQDRKDWLGQEWRAEVRGSAGGSRVASRLMSVQSWQWSAVVPFAKACRPYRASGGTDEAGRKGLAKGRRGPAAGRSASDLAIGQGLLELLYCFVARKRGTPKVQLAQVA